MCIRDSRYSDLALYMGLVVYYTLIGRSFYMALAAVAMASSFMVSYSRARAESLIPLCKVGFMAVSYTHLDVYKRQTEIRSSAIPWRFWKT